MDHIEEKENNRDNYELHNYMVRQPRAKLDNYTFNFEEYGKYTEMYRKARVIDEDQTKDFYKLVKYLKSTKEEQDKAAGENKTKMANLSADFLRRYKLDLIDIPEEFVDDGEPIKLPLMKTKMVKRVYTRSCKSLVNYDSWRVFDRHMTIQTGRDQAVAKLMIPPALLKRAFGTP